MGTVVIVGMDGIVQRIGYYQQPQPPSPLPYQFTKEEDRGKWEDISAAIDFFAGNNGDEGGRGSVEGR